MKNNPPTSGPGPGPVPPTKPGKPAQPAQPATPKQQPIHAPVNPDPKAHPIHPAIPTQPIHEGTDPSQPVTGDGDNIVVR
jgi:hypothetical protein